jgi:hypothetical protein
MVKTGLHTGIGTTDTCRPGGTKGSLAIRRLRVNSVRPQATRALPATSIYLGTTWDRGRLFARRPSAAGKEGSTERVAQVIVMMTKQEDRGVRS